MADEKDQIVTTLTQVREKRGLSMREVARQSGLSVSLVSEYEAGTRSPTLTSLHAWAASLGCTLRVIPPGKPTSDE